jgi:hypothetical protein
VRCNVEGNALTGTATRDFKLIAPTFTELVLNSVNVDIMEADVAIDAMKDDFIFDIKFQG